MPAEIFWIDQPDQIKVLGSAMRQEIVDVLSVTGPCSIAELAHELGVAADSLYYHVRKLKQAGLLVEQDARVRGKQTEAVYGLPGEALAFRYDKTNPANVEAVGKAVGSMLRSAERDFHAGFRSERSVPEGEARNLWASRVRAWLTEEERVEVNQLLARLYEICERPRSDKEEQLCTLTWVLAPLEPQAARREPKS